MADKPILDKKALALAYLHRLAAGKGPKQKPKPKRGYVYFCGPVDGPIKIGFSRDPDDRLYRLQTSRPERLHLWAEMPGTDADEDAYHIRFWRHHLGGEWFARTPEIEAEIARLNAEAA